MQVQQIIFTNQHHFREFIKALFLVTMPNNLEHTRSSSALGQWVEDLYDRLFWQSNDEVSASALRECLSDGFIARCVRLCKIFTSSKRPELTVPLRINHDQFTRQTFMEAIMKFRVDNTASVQSIKDIQVWDAPDGSGAGCVSQLVHSTDSNKETGIDTKFSILLIASIKVIDGQKLLVELTEVSKTIKEDVTNQ